MKITDAIHEKKVQLLQFILFLKHYNHFALLIIVFLSTQLAMLNWNYIEYENYKYFENNEVSLIIPASSDQFFMQIKPLNSSVLQECMNNSFASFIWVHN